MYYGPFIGCLVFKLRLALLLLYLFMVHVLIIFSSVLIFCPTMKSMLRLPLFIQYVLYN